MDSNRGDIPDHYPDGVDVNENNIAPVAEPVVGADIGPDRLPAGRGTPAPVDENRVAQTPEIASVPHDVPHAETAIVPHDFDAEKPSNVVQFIPKNAESVSSLKTKNKAECATCGTEAISTRGTSPAATRGTKAGKWQVDSVKASTNTWAFRVRWTVGRERGTPAYITRVSDSVYKKIKKDKRVYEQYKRQIISLHESCALRACN